MPRRFAAWDLLPWDSLSALAMSCFSLRDLERGFSSVNFDFLYLGSRSLAESF